MASKHLRCISYSLVALECGQDENLLFGVVTNDPDSEVDDFRLFALIPREKVAGESTQHSKLHHAPELVLDRSIEVTVSSSALVWVQEVVVANVASFLTDTIICREGMKHVYVCEYEYKSKTNRSLSRIEPSVFNYGALSDTSNMVICKERSLLYAYTDYVFRNCVANRFSRELRSNRGRRNTISFSISGVNILESTYFFEYLRFRGCTHFTNKDGTNNTEYLHDSGGIRKVRTPKRLVCVDLNDPVLLCDYLGIRYCVYPIVPANFTVGSLTGYQCVRIIADDRCLSIQYDVNTLTLFVKASVEVILL